MPRLRRSKPLTAPQQGQGPLALDVREPLKGQSPKPSREHPDGQEEVGPTGEPLGPVGRQAPRGEDTMQMGMLVELLAPGVQHRLLLAGVQRLLTSPGLRIARTSA